MSVEELLAQLKDIQQPIEPGWWPLAMGWWYLVFLVFLVYLTLWFLKKRKLANRGVVVAFSELEKIKDEYLQNNNNNQLACNLSIWLKKVSLYAFPEQTVAGLTGQRWLEFLDKSSGGTQFTSGVGKVFADSIYAKDLKVNATELIQLCENWLATVKPEIIKQGQG